MTAFIRPKAASATVSFGTTEQVVEEAINKMYDPRTWPRSPCDENLARVTFCIAAAIWARLGVRRLHQFQAMVSIFPRNLYGTIEQGNELRGLKKTKAHVFNR
jgi:hypothetical protein